MKKATTWRRFRHRVVFGLLRYPLTAYTVLRYGVKVDRFRQQGKRPYLIVMNHQTGFDQFFVGMFFRDPVYYMATEDIFSTYLTISSSCP